MQAQCISKQLEFKGLGKRKVVGEFSGGNVSSDAGGLLLREVEASRDIIKRFAACFDDHRDPELIGQRVYGIALGYEDLTDHDDIRKDPLLATTVEELERITKQLRRHWPDVKKILRGDSGFARDEIMAWCEANRVEYILGLAKNKKLLKKIKKKLEHARRKHSVTQRSIRYYQELRYMRRFAYLKSF